MSSSHAPSNRPRIAILASGRGSNFVALAEAIADGRLDADIVVVASNRKLAPVLERAAALSLPTVYEKDLLKLRDILLERGVNWIVLAGFMKILTPDFIAAFRDPRGFSRIVNIHPSLLPAFPGLYSYRQAFEHGAKITGVTVHLVDHDVDTGPICAQECFSIAHFQSADEVEAAGLKVEHRLYAETLNWLLKDRFDIIHRGGRLHVQPH